jgi:predicted flap endonuclease-1-like 5' DNA nuclease
MSTVVSAVTFLCLFFAMAIGFGLGMVIRVYGNARTRPSETEEKRTLRLVEVSAAESRKELAELRMTVMELRASLGELGISDSMKKLALLDIIWNKLGLLEATSLRLATMEEKLGLLEENTKTIPLLSTREDLEALEEQTRMLDLSVSTLPTSFEERVRTWRDVERLERLDQLAQLSQIHSRLELLDALATRNDLSAATDKLPVMHDLLASRVAMRNDLETTEERLGRVLEALSATATREDVDHTREHLTPMLKGIERLAELHAEQQTQVQKEITQQTHAQRETTREILAAVSAGDQAYQALGTTLATLPALISAESKGLRESLRAFESVQSLPKLLEAESRATRKATAEAVGTIPGMVRKETEQTSATIENMNKSVSKAIADAAADLRALRDVPALLTRNATASLEAHANSNAAIKESKAAILTAHADTNAAIKDSKAATLEALASSLAAVQESKRVILAAHNVSAAAIQESKTAILAAHASSAAAVQESKNAILAAHADTNTASKDGTATILAAHASSAAAIQESKTAILAAHASSAAAIQESKTAILAAQAGSNAASKDGTAAILAAQSSSNAAILNAQTNSAIALSESKSAMLEAHTKSTAALLEAHTKSTAALLAAQVKNSAAVDESKSAIVKAQTSGFATVVEALASRHATVVEALTSSHTSLLAAHAPGHALLARTSEELKALSALQAQLGALQKLPELVREIPITVDHYLGSLATRDQISGLQKVFETDRLTHSHALASLQDAHVPQLALLQNLERKAQELLKKVVAEAETTHRAVHDVRKEAETVHVFREESRTAARELKDGLAQLERGLLQGFEGLRAPQTEQNLARESSLHAVREDLLLSDAQVRTRIGELQTAVEDLLGNLTTGQDPSPADAATMRDDATPTASTKPTASAKTNAGASEERAEKRAPTSTRAGLGREGRAVKESDDLTEIVGIGPALAKLLKRRGIRRFEDLARLSKEEIATLDESLPRFRGRIRREKWVAQAKRLMK